MGFAKVSRSPTESPLAPRSTVVSVRARSTTWRRSPAEAAKGTTSAKAPASRNVALCMIGFPFQTLELIGEIYTKSARLVSGYPRDSRLLPREHRVVDRQRGQFVGQVRDDKVRAPLARDNAGFQVNYIVRRQRF